MGRPPPTGGIGAHRHRAQHFVLRFGYLTGLRLSGLVATRTGHPRAEMLDETLGVAWLLTVSGKGGAA
ncbi:MAG: hypothetical protein WCA12_17025 [Burkholderiales bacterium]